MIRADARRLLAAVASGSVTVDQALHQLATAPTAALLDATLDLHRGVRQGFPEVVLAAGKTPDQVVAAALAILQTGDGVLITRAEADVRARLLVAIPDAEVNATARTVFVAPRSATEPTGAPVVVITAGTSDLPVADEAVVTASAHGARVVRIVDVGVAGLHRLAPHLEALGEAGAVIVVAGMDGALASVIGGIVATPVIAVPTSTGYGASFGGISALLAMLNSCAAGVTVVNIDNGFGAGVAAARIVTAASRRG